MIMMTSQTVLVLDTGPRKSDADSRLSVVRITPCTKAGNHISLPGSGGRPKEREERDKKTPVW
jgi:hypothetical protein